MLDFIRFAIANAQKKWFGFMPAVSIVFGAGIVAAAGLWMGPVGHAQQIEPQNIDQTFNEIDEALLYPNFSPVISLSDGPDDFAGFVLVDKGIFLNNFSPTSNTRPTFGGLLSYSIKEGDSLSTIAAEFGITTNTIIWANNIKRSNLIRPGQEILILPVSGVLHSVKPGETLGSIATMYGVSIESISTYNKNGVVEGDVVIVPYAKPIKRLTSASYLPSLDLAFPVVDGYNWGYLHGTNAVDIAARCGTPIFASADGLVVDVGSPKAYNLGFGGFIEILHDEARNIRTLYAHTSDNGTTSVGEIVSRGDEIAKIGNTGRVHGPTGCHVHLEVYGAKNPFVR
ncbi:MAG: LysM peptidoglycan-binding domain-containing protein [Candidatus Colwellbacteria bacterium]|nr:LysM peptidoglycan-binding domain-containing protein [Candidatus Colwellbacteria bacterium]